MPSVVAQPEPRQSNRVLNRRPSSSTGGERTNVQYPLLGDTGTPFGDGGQRCAILTICSSLRPLLPIAGSLPLPARWVCPNRASVAASPCWRSGSEGDCLIERRGASA